MDTDIPSPVIQARRIWPSPLGPLMGIAGDRGLHYLGFLSFTADISSCEPSGIPGGSVQAGRSARECLDLTGLQLSEYFRGERTRFSVPLDLQGTAFQRKVWNALFRIPCGKTSTYKIQTDALGDPLAIRAVASANGRNPVAILVPCHRVIGTGGKLTGYAGGLWRKRWLLDHEQAMVPTGQVRMF